MRVLITTLAYHPYVGGHAVATAAVAEKLAQKGHKVSILTSNLIQFSPLKKAKTELDQLNGVSIVRFDAIWPDLSGVKSSLKGKFGRVFTTLIDKLSELDEKRPCLENVFFLARALSFPFTPQMLFWDLTSDINSDIIHAFDLVWSTSFISYMMAKKRKLRYVITPFLHLYSPRHRGNSLFKVLRGADAIIAVTESERNFIVERGVPQKKVHLIGVGVETEKLEGGCGVAFRLKYGIPPEDPIILFVGRKEVDKGVIQLLKSMGYIWSQIPNARLVIIGPNGILPSDVKMYYDTLSLVPTNKRQNVLDLGIVSEKEKLDAFSASDVFAMPSRRDSFGIVYLEAWYYRKPVVGALCEPIWDVIDDKVNGILVRFGDEKDLANNLLGLLKNEKMREEIGERGYEKVMTKYNSETTVSEIENVYKKCSQCS